MNAWPTRSDRERNEVQMYRMEDPTWIAKTVPPVPLYVNDKPVRCQKNCIQILERFSKLCGLELGQSTLKFQSLPRLVLWLWQGVKLLNIAILGAERQSACVWFGLRFQRQRSYSWSQDHWRQQHLRPIVLKLCSM